jgi:eukaryotic-like serine/threonine-protein kinase
MHGSSVVLIALLTSAVTATGTTFLIQKYRVFSAIEEVRAAAVPGLLGLSEADARANAHALGFALLVEGREGAAGVEAGTVLRQSVAAGQQLPAGSSIGVVFAAAMPKVPKVTKLSLEEAREALTKKGYKVAEGAPVTSAQVATGKVAQQAPEANSELAAGGVVTLQLSSGPQEVAAPKLSGLGLKAAEQRLTELGLVPKVRWISKAETVTGSVLSQKPAPGEKLTPGSAVELVVNR